MRSKIRKKVASRGKTQDILDRKIYAAVSCPIKTTVKIEIRIDPFNFRIRFQLRQNFSHDTFHDDITGIKIPLT